MLDSGGLVQKNQANVTSAKHIHNYSTFNRSLSYRLYNTLRFGDYTPSFNMEGVPSDEIQLNSLDRIDSLSLNAPFKGSIRKIKESFMVPNMAILPMNWDKIYAQPSDGDDVPKDANCVIEDFPSYAFNLWYNAFNVLAPSTAPTSSQYSIWTTALLRCLVLGEYFYSHGSLLNVCGYKASAQWRYLRNSATEVLSYDQWFDQVVAYVFSKVKSISVTEPIGSSTKIHDFKGLSGSVTDYHFNLPFRALLELFRENPLCYISTLNVESNFGDIFTNIAAADSFFLSTGTGVGPQSILPSSSYNSDDVTDMSQRNLNLSRLLAYQIVCAHYYTNSSIDFIYSAELYRQYIYSFYSNSGEAFKNDGYTHFTWNGNKVPYDYLSGHIISQMMFFAGYNTWHYLQAFNAFNYSFTVLGANPSSGNNGQFLRCLPVIAAIFGFRKSLRYGDYFVAARPRPLAPINTDVAVNNSLVSVVDITRNIQAQRFANAVMRSRSKIENYVKSLFGRAPAPDYHNPFFLTRSEEMIFGDEVQNTGEAQINANGVGKANSRTANFAGNVSPYTFTFHNDDQHPCIYVQIISFDIKRAYTRSVERQFLHADRFDMFNPDFQYIGDQKVYGIELGYPYNGSIPDTFAYQSRDMEYKERFDQASSGFVENLPGWCLTDNFRSFDVVQSIDPDFIRSYNTELDQFFLSLTGFSLGSYFHFTCITDNNVNAKRAMAVDPQILA